MAEILEVSGPSAALTSEESIIHGSAFGSLEAYKISQCQKKFRVYECLNGECNHYGEKYVVVYNCHSRLCPRCARARAMKWYHKLERIYFVDPKHLTLTLRVNRDLRGSIILIQKAFRKLRKKFKIDCGIYSIELKKKPTGFFVHLHALIDSIYIPIRQISKVWRKLTGSFVCYIEKVSSSDDGIREVCKYVTKGLGRFNPVEVGQIAKAIYGLRMINTWGMGIVLSLLDTQETSSQKLLCPHCKKPLTYTCVMDHRETMNEFLDGKLLFWDPDWFKPQESNNQVVKIDN